MARCRHPHRSHDRMSAARGTSIWLDAWGAAAGERCRQLPPRGDSEFPEDVAQVGSHRS
jgi:hypothetical protein